MRHYLTISILILLTNLTYGQTRTIKKTLLFSTAESELTSVHKSTLDSILDTLKSADNYSIVVSGHTDSDGEPEYNTELSKRRANSVTEYFVQNEIPKNKIVKSFFGGTKPVSPNDTEQGKQKNRRVDILIRIQTVEPVPDTLDTLIEKHSTIWELYQQTEMVPQKFCINTNKDTVLRCKQGTIIYIKANSFKGIISNTSRNCVTIEVKEVLLKSDMILENLSTTSNGQIIETQGMIYVNAKFNGETLSLVPDKDIIIMVPTDTIISGVKIFDGNRNPHDSIINWTVNNNSVLSDFSLPQLEYCSDILCLKRCPFLFCKIKKFFRNLFDSNTDRAFQREVTITKNIPDTCKTLAELFKKYGVNNLTSLIDAINQPLYKKLKVDNFTSLKRAIEEEKIKAIELNYKNKKVAFEDFKYYVYNTPKLGWSNLDVFADLKPNQLTTIKVNIQPDVNNDVKLVFKNRNFVLPASDRKDKYIFNGVPKGEEIWIVAVKYDNGVPYLSMTEVTIERKIFDVEFVQLKLTELKKRLKVLDRK